MSTRPVSQPGVFTLVLQASEGLHLFLLLLSKDCPSFDGCFLKLWLDGLRIIGLSTPMQGKGPWLSPPRCHKTLHLVSRDASPSHAGPVSIPSGGVKPFMVKLFQVMSFMSCLDAVFGSYVPMLGDSFRGFRFHV